LGTFFTRIARYSHWAVFLFLEILSGVLLFRFNHYQGSVWFTQANAVAGRMLGWESKGLAFLNLVENNHDLTQENLVLQYNIGVLQEELTRLTHDSSYTERVQSNVLKGKKIISAKVITNSILQRNNYLTIDKGKADGVELERGVVSGTGIVGITCMVSDHYSVVLPILNSKSNISCRLRGTHYFGYLKWKGGNPLHAYMSDVPLHAHCRVGDVVETSGFSSVFPPGIFVGKVVQVHSADDGLAYQLEVQLSTDLARVRDVCVVTSINQAEQDSIESQIEK